jgi:hypothetical protein
MSVDRDRLGSWLERFGHARETRDPDRAAALFVAANGQERPRP